MMSISKYYLMLTCDFPCHVNSRKTLFLQPCKNIIAIIIITSLCFPNSYMGDH